MEVALGRSSGHGCLIKEEKMDNSSVDEEGRRREEIIAKVPDVTKTERSSVEGANSKASSSTQKDQDDYHELESAKAEMGEVREENKRLRMYLDQAMKDYETLQMQFHDIVQQVSKRSKDNTTSQPRIEEPEFVSLSLGRTSSDSKKLDESNKTSSCKLGQEDEHFKVKHGLAQGLDCKFEVSKKRSSLPEASPNPTISPENSSFEEQRDEEISQQNNNVKRARVSVRARCDTPMMNDGCQWRKYGQKIAKGNPYPRAYYRCTVAPSCPVRKQVQRCAQDMSILITTYEGTHNHPLPMAATAMASTTSAAASMLLSGSSSSHPGLVPSASTTTAAIDQLHGLNFYLSDNSKPKQFYFPNTSIYSSLGASHPTITLDLTSSSISSSSSYSSHFNRSCSTYPPTPRYSSLNYSSLESNTLPISWSNGHLTHGNTTQTYNTTTNTNGTNGSSINLGTRQSSQESNFYQSFMQKNNPTNISQQSLVPDTSHSTIAAATKAITSDPTFQSALVAALTSIIGGNPGNLSQGGLGENLGQKLKWGDQFLPSTSTYQSASKGNGNGCGSSLNNRPSPASSLMFLPPSSSLPFSSSKKSASTSPNENRDHAN